MRTVRARNTDSFKNIILYLCLYHIVPVREWRKARFYIHSHKDEKVSSEGSWMKGFVWDMKFGWLKQALDDCSRSWTRCKTEMD